MGYHRDMYEATRNPWYAWEEYRESRQGAGSRLTGCSTTSTSRRAQFTT
jgi:hypothetical protein